MKLEGRENDIDLDTFMVNITLLEESSNFKAYFPCATTS